MEAAEDHAQHDSPPQPSVLGKLLGWSPPVVSAQLRTGIAVQGYPLWTPVAEGVGGQLGGQAWEMPGSPRRARCRKQRVTLSCGPLTVSASARSSGATSHTPIGSSAIVPHHAVSNASAFPKYHHIDVISHVNSPSSGFRRRHVQASPAT
jgi:hypothetical protein